MQSTRRAVPAIGSCPRFRANRAFRQTGEALLKIIVVFHEETVRMRSAYTIVVITLCLTLASCTSEKSRTPSASKDGNVTSSDGKSKELAGSGTRTDGSGTRNRVVEPYARLSGDSVPAPDIVEVVVDNPIPSISRIAPHVDGGLVVEFQHEIVELIR